MGQDLGGKTQKGSPVKGGKKKKKFRGRKKGTADRLIRRKGKRKKCIG